MHFQIRRLSNFTWRKRCENILCFSKKKPVDLQLPQKQKQIQLPIFEKTEPPPPQRTFKEKIVTQININDSDDEGASTTFKKRKIGNKNVRKRTTDD